MRIVHIIPTLQKGGAERLVLDIVKGLDKKAGIEIALVVMHEVVDYPIDAISHLLHYIPAQVHLSLKRKNKKNVITLEKFITDFKPDIIHSHLFEAEIVSRSIHYPQARWFSHCHDNMVQFKQLTAYKKPTKQALTNAYEKKYLFKRYKKNGGTHFIAISNDAYTYFKPRIKNHPITLLHNAINFNHFYKPLTSKQKSEPACLPLGMAINNKQQTNNEPATTKINNSEPASVTINNRSHSDRNNNPINLINIGSFVPKKNQAFLIKVVELLVQKKYRVHLDFLGDGTLRKKLEQEVKQKGLSSHITFHGNVSDVPKHLHQATIYTHSATYEPLGLVLLEAMAAGLPVVCLDGKGNRDLILEGQNGFMVDTENVEVFVERILRLWEDEGLYEDMRGKAQVFARGFDIGEYVDRLVEVYEGKH